MSTRASRSETLPKASTRTIQNFLQRCDSSVKSERTETLDNRDTWVDKVVQSGNLLFASHKGSKVSVALHHDHGTLEVIIELRKGSECIETSLVFRGVASRRSTYWHARIVADIVTVD